MITNRIKCLTSLVFALGLRLALPVHPGSPRPQTVYNLQECTSARGFLCWMLSILPPHPSPKSGTLPSWDFSCFPSWSSWCSQLCLRDCVLFCFSEFAACSTDTWCTNGYCMAVCEGGHLYSPANSLRRAENASPLLVVTFTAKILGFVTKEYYSHTNCNGIFKYIV